MPPHSAASNQPVLPHMPARPPMAFLEVPVFGAFEAVAAAAAGAGRIELNAPASYAFGGYTPAVEEVLAVSRSVSIPVRVMVRPPANSDQGEQTQGKQMVETVGVLAACGALQSGRGDGFVFGMAVAGLPGERARIDVPLCRALIAAAAPYPCTFHRAFDDVIASAANDVGVVEKAIRDLLACGFRAVLTSGGPGSAAESGNLDVLERIALTVAKLAGNTLQVIVGGGVRSGNVARVTERVCGRGADVWMHSSCLTGSDSKEVDGEELKLMLERLN